MRTFFLSILSLFLGFNSLAQWIPIPSGTDVDLRAVHFPTDSIGYIAGDYGVILKSTDQGNTWSNIHQDSSYFFNSVFFTSPEVGYATSGNLMKTTDGGFNWNIVLPSAFIEEVYFVNDTLGFAAESQILYRTIDGGNSWMIALQGANISSIHFPSEKTGYFIGGNDFNDPLYKTLDAGETFLPVTNNFQSVKEVTFYLNDSVGYMGGWYGVMFEKTIDGGATWTSINSPIPAHCWDLYFKDESTGYYINNVGGQYQIHHTEDGGESWVTQLDAPHYLSEFYFIQPTVGIVVGDLGSIYKLDADLGLSEVYSRVHFEIYPNPVVDEFILDLGTNVPENTLIEIFSALGKRVCMKKASGLRTVVNLGSLPAGIYFIQLRNENGKTMGVKKINLNPLK